MAVYIKWHITQKRATDSYGAVESSNFNLYDKEGNKLEWCENTTAESSIAAWAGQDANNLIDANINTKWGSPNWGNSVYGDAVVIFTVPDESYLEKIGSYSYTTGHDNTAKDPVSWELLFSKDGVDYVLIDLQDNADIPTGRKTETGKWSVDWKTTEMKYLIESGSVIYTVADGVLQALSETDINASLFQTYGVNDIPDGSLLIGLVNPSVMCWTTEDELPTISATVSAVPLPQTIITNEIDLTHHSITGIENMIATCEGDLIIAVSFDNKQTWKAWNGSEWSLLSEEFTGMNKETLEAITFEQWNLLYNGATGFYIRIALADITQSVTEIYTDFAN